VKVLLVHEDRRSYGQGGGAETMLRDLTRALELCGHEVKWYQGEGDFETMMTTWKPDVCQVMTVHNFLGFAQVRWLQRNRYPHVWALMDYWPFCGGRMLLKAGDRESCAAVRGVCDGECEKGPAALILRELVNRSPVLALNENTAAIYRRNGLRCDFVAELGTDADYFHPAPNKRKPGTIITTSAWPGFSTKGMHVLKAALAQIGAQATLVTGKSRQEVRDALQTAAIFVFPSTYEETYGLCLTEAMATGLACVASDVCGSRAQITDGETGRLFPNRDAGVLAGILRELLDDDGECRRLGANARTHILSEHTLEAVGRRFEAVYRKVSNG